MAAGRTVRSLVGRRRRADEEEEDDDGPAALEEDSQSEASVLSDAEDDEGEEGSVEGPPDTEAGVAATAATAPKDLPSSPSSKSRKPRKPRNKDVKSGNESLAEPHQTAASFKPMADTRAMMNGLSIGEDAQGQDAVDFESGQSAAPPSAIPSAPNGHPARAVDQQRREHEEYRRKRDADPAFIPNRGNFFMHDTRGQNNGQGPPLRGAWQARNVERGAEQPWKHDLHDTINEDPQTTPSAQVHPHAPRDDRFDSTRLFPKASAPVNPDQSRRVSFSTTKLVGTVRIQVALAGSKAPVTFSEVPWRQYTRLPDHRPPLRRDKPVRVSLPGHTQRYVFPSPERSFIFIPRQNRPNQSGYHRGSYQRSVGGHGYSSRRTSMYGGSLYSGSVAPSRRSSMAGIAREAAFSPVSSIAGMGASRSRIGQGSQQFSGVSTPIGPLSGHQTPIGMMQMHSYPPPQQPAHFGTPTTTVHQPRPQKTISVSGIEPPPSQQGDAQPFRNQLPAHMHELQQPAPPPAPYFSPQHLVSPPQLQAGTPLTGIPEQAIHAPTFQPPPFGQAAYYAPYGAPPPQTYYYPQSAPHSYAQMPMYPMGAQHGYMVGAHGQQMPQQQHPHHHQHSLPQPSSSVPNDVQRAPSGMVAHESNGMVYYVPASEAQQSEQYQPAEGFVPTYAMPGLPPPTPAPEGSMEYYYPPVRSGGQDGAYFSGQPQQ
ncbi:CASC3/Barentsz eIF4AIII binding-domain-containing protein [Neohortaea acidophila]|uniref:CASC3/Barentsz eIF4AIII binding-domain-containing protein n=1 Tax=Neohortaea acidophila TaxID=245834 RepID=A0A6A6PRE8_9PEZI|nr:CASC3/Barentsz eIF4AIII binding-domain-containing protein [Neohortaea acidophila]KAF2482708.1 CASC3/Barentsz eIF4AIII binding-domain-containing protein [Neohortaea acidophila]